MKKITSLVLAAVLLAAMLSVFAVPTFAEDEPTEIEPGTTINLNDGGNYIVGSGKDIEVGSFRLGSLKNPTALTIPKDTTVTVTGIFSNSGIIHVYGTLIVKSQKDVNNNGTIQVEDGGTFTGLTSNLGTLIYGEHTFTGFNCSHCNMKMCEITGHVLDKNGLCGFCHKAGCQLGISEHSWSNGICTVCRCMCYHPGWKGSGDCPVCGMKYCAITNNRHNWQDGICTVCGTTCQHEWNNSVCTVCGMHCPHDNWKDGECTACNYRCTHEGNSCVVCGKALKTLNNGVVGSMFTGGSLTAIVGIAALALGIFGGFLLGRRKNKPATANGAANEDSEE